MTTTPEKSLFSFAKTLKKSHIIYTVLLYLNNFAYVIPKEKLK